MNADPIAFKTMNTRISIIILAIITSAFPTAWAEDPLLPADSSKAGAIITKDPVPSRWRMGINYAPMIGLKTEFTGLGTFNPNFTPQPLGGGVDYEYDDGFVRVDSSGNFGNETWNWGYSKSSQVNPTGSGSIDYTLSKSLANASASEDGDAEGGFEFFEYLDMGKTGITLLDDHNATWGFRGGFNYTRIDVKSTASIYSTVETQTDRFNLAGTIPPSAPYTGSFAGPGPLLGDLPSRSFGPGAQSLVTGSRELEVDLSTFNLGTYFELPVTTNLNLMFQGGISAGFASGSYNYQSETHIGGIGSQTSSGDDSETRFLPGFYMGIDAVYQLDKNWGIQAGGRYQYLDEFNLNSNGSGASLSFDSAFVLTVGALYSF